MGVSLRPTDAIPEYEGPNYLVSNLIPAESLIVLGTEEDTDRRRFLLQICSAVQHGRPLFRGAFPVEQGDTIFVASGPGELHRAEEIAIQWGQRLNICTVKRSVKEFENMLSSIPDCRLVVIEDATQQRPPFNRWLSRHIGGAQDEKTKKRLMSNLTTSMLNDLRREHAREFMSELLRVTSERHLSIILGHGLTTTGKLFDQGGFQGKDEAITLLWSKRDGVYRLSIERSGMHLGSDHWDLQFNRGNGRFQLAGRSARKARQTAAAKGQPLPFTDVERALLKTLRERGPMRHSQIVALRLTNPNPRAPEGAVLGGSTISDRLRALQSESKRCAVVRLEDRSYKYNPKSEKVQ
jgi:hypothetical protein